MHTAAIVIESVTLGMPVTLFGKRYEVIAIAFAGERDMSRKLTLRAEDEPTPVPPVELTMFLGTAVEIPQS